MPPVDKNAALILKKYKTPLAIPVRGVTVIGGKKPVDTQLGSLGLDEVTLSKLSPAAQKLTKGDLIALWDDKQTPATNRVTVKDIGVLKTAFNSKLGVNPAAMDINCCCCPCCCAATVMRPVAIA